MTTGSSSSASDDKLWAALAWVFSPLVPIILLLMEDKKKIPALKENSVMALAWSVALFIILFVLGIVTFGLITCIVPLAWIPQLYWGYQAYQGKSVNIPILSDFVKKQGWA
jgi:uncharacterized membrane protein